MSLFCPNSQVTVLLIFCSGASGWSALLPFFDAMSKLNADNLADQFKEKYPAFPSYLECQSRAFMYGLATFSLSFAVTYFGQELYKKRMPYGPKYFILPSVVIASVASWTMTRRKTRDCQLMWMAAEGRHTALSPIEQEKPLVVPAVP